MMFEPGQRLRVVGPHIRPPYTTGQDPLSLGEVVTYRGESFAHEGFSLVQKDGSATYVHIATSSLAPADSILDREALIQRLAEIFPNDTLTSILAVAKYVERNPRLERMVSRIAALVPRSTPQNVLQVVKWIERDNV